MNIKWIFILVMLFSVFYTACVKDPEIVPDRTELDILHKTLNIPDQAFNYASPNLPSFFNNSFIQLQNNTPADNLTSDWGATLGRVLFYDTRLSLNHTISCASCHVQAFGFTDTAVLSKGFNGGLTKRHSMSLINAAYYNSGRFFWDERAATLEDQVLQPIQDLLEMGMTLDSLENRLKQTEFYPILFKYAFGSTEINRQLIAKALAQFVRSMVSFNSPFDIGRSMAANSKVNFANFTQEENLGKTIFMEDSIINCSGCHTTDLFVMDNPRNNGISFTNSDLGVFIHTNQDLDKGKFKAPSLKNIALRVNFMHDGSFRGLASVVEHYNAGIQPNPNLDPHLADLVNGGAKTMNLNASEKKALLAFLNTLTDEKIIRDEKYSSPFR